MTVAGPARHRADPAARRQLLALALLFGLAVTWGAAAGLLGGSQPLPYVHAGSSASLSPQLLLLLLLIVPLISLTLVLGLGVRHVLQGGFAPGTGTTLVAGVVICLVVVALLAAASAFQRPVEGSLGSLGSNHGTSPGENSSLPGGNASTNATRGNVSLSAPIPVNGAWGWGTFVAALGIAAALVVALRWYLRTEELPEGPWTAEGPPRRVESDLRRAQEALRRGEPHGAREEILQAYADLLEDLGRTPGWVGHDALTPREIEGAMGERLRIGPGSSQLLRELFERARYSTDPLGPQESRAAADALERILDELHPGGGPP